MRIIIIIIISSSSSSSPLTFIRRKRSGGPLTRTFEAFMDKALPANPCFCLQEVKGFLQKQRELDGIDMSNIIQGRPKRGAAVAAVQTVNRRVFSFWQQLG